jgi:hypothetical protein
MAASAVKLSPALKALIAAPHAMGSAIPAPSRPIITSLFDGIRSRGESGGVGSESWLTLSSAALVTVNSPETVCELFTYAANRKGDVQDQVHAAGVIRETALKCISFSGVSGGVGDAPEKRDRAQSASSTRERLLMSLQIPRTINALVALRAHLPEAVKQGLSSEPQR